ncbi:hypothetical protein [Curtobacterium sp. PhB115]|uniref:hypothetical protein n=1 Tax=Curtobacterium sp. PhB115 TaxID=2485173 RepID=UPI000FB04882|nr:hypothetical protein [Curtobacterium sp. PhB115]ROP74415.1 hypothetical protein EDF19_0499 [Curtobacterium sp. PhB115]
MDLAQLDKQQTEDRINAESAAALDRTEAPESANPSPAPAPNPKDRESRRWMLTLPESEYDRAEVEKRLGKYKAVIGQLEEAPTTGYRHWQLYLEAKSAVRFSTLRKLFPKGHYTPARETRIQCVRYCTKETSRVGEQLNLGQLNFAVKQGKRTDLDSYAEQIMIEGKSADEVIWDDARAVKFEKQLNSLQLIRDRKTWGNVFREVEVHYIHGGTRTGKTSALYETYGYEGIFRVPNWRNPFDGYKGEDIVVLDEYNTSVAMVDMLKILEGYPLELAARFSDKTAKFTKVFIVSNLRVSQQHRTLQEEHPEQWEAFKARLTSVSEMLPGGKLQVEKGMPPQLNHYLEQRPVEILLPGEKPTQCSLASVQALADDDHFEDGEFADEADEFFGN